MKRFGWLIAIGLVLVIILAIGLGIAGSYNGLVKKSQAVDSQLAQVETQYQRRFDLIPNMVATVKGYLKQELAIFGEITEARAAYGSAQTVEEKSAASIQFENALSRLLVIVEDNPEIKSDKVMIGLMDELAGTENRISVERKRYNDAVRDYNTAVKSFPTNIIAGIFNFDEREYFASVSGADKPPVVEF
ncbi:MAG: LemA family protein [Dehalococcoidia bacterium]|nr:MAG: LemA family protein [Dehalococcoidia bacterium]